MVVDDEPANRVFVANVLSAAQWDVVEVEDGAAVMAVATRASPDLIIMDIDMLSLDGWSATAAIRAAGPPLSNVPILAYTTMRLTDAEILARGMNGRLPKPSTADSLIAAVAPWRPDGGLAGVHRLIDVFGRDEMTRLVLRFRDQLAEALGALDAGAANALAHRLAGVAGTLGFAEVSASWLRLSEGDESACDDARHDARIALACIDRDWSPANRG
ncbi:response regulator [uncultured Sphingomonas sp.]|uniref:response regulator n=1 Tax=uncultured Sphingomonas sp. TaxID=158754 RepID=UPI0035CA7831